MNPVLLFQTIPESQKNNLRAVIFIIIYDQMKGGDNIGRLLIMEYTDEERFIFDEVMEILKKHPEFQKYEIQNESKWSLSGLEIHLTAGRYTVMGKRFI